MPTQRSLLIAGGLTALTVLGVVLLRSQHAPGPGAQNGLPPPPPRPGPPGPEPVPRPGPAEDDIVANQANDILRRDVRDVPVEFTRNLAAHIEANRADLTRQGIPQALRQKADMAERAQGGGGVGTPGAPGVPAPGNIPMPVNAPGFPPGIPPGLPLRTTGRAQDVLLNQYGTFMHAARIPGCDVPPCPEPRLDADTVNAMLGTAGQLERLGRGNEAFVLRSRAQAIQAALGGQAVMRPTWCNAAQLPPDLQTRFNALTVTTNPLDIPEMLAVADILRQCSPLFAGAHQQLLEHARVVALTVPAT